MPAGARDDLIYDVGMHRGDDTGFYLKKGFRVVGIEADPALCAQAAATYAPYVADGRLTILNVAIAPKAGPVRFFRNTRISVWGTLSPEWAARNAIEGAPSEEIVVEGARFGDILSAHGTPYYLKIDIEGMDRECLRPLVGADMRPRHVSIESDKTSWVDLLEEFRLFGAIGYRRFKIVPQLDVVHQKAPEPPLEGTSAEHRFAFGSSGLFGEEAPGPWLSEAEALRQYRRIFRHYRLFGDRGRLRLARSRAERWLPERLRLATRNHWYDTHATF